MALAATDNSRFPTDKTISIAISQEPGAELQLEARGAPLAQILNEIAVKTKVPIHYSILPEGLVTATCVGPNVKKVLECLIGARVDLVFRYIHDTQENQPPPVAEVWLLGTNIGITQISAANCPAIVAQQLQIESPVEHDASQAADTTQEAIDESNKLLKQAQSKNPLQRAEAIANLGAMGLKDDMNVKETLRAAMFDKDPNVRSQAVTTMAQRGGEDVAAELSQALLDKDVNVRFAVVSNVYNDVTLLRQASRDTDKMVRELAMSKLADLEAQQNQ